MKKQKEEQVMLFVSIKDLKEFKVVKRTSEWNGYCDELTFVYKGERYRVHEKYEYEEPSEIFLYKLDRASNKYVEQEIDTTWGELPSFKYKFKPDWSRFKPTYSQISKEDLIWDLTWLGVINSEYCSEIDKRLERIQSAEKRIRKLKSRTLEDPTQ